MSRISPTIEKPTSSSMSWDRDFQAAFFLSMCASSGFQSGILLISSKLADGFSLIKTFSLFQASQMLVKSFDPLAGLVLHLE